MSVCSICSKCQTVPTKHLHSSPDGLGIYPLSINMKNIRDEININAINIIYRRWPPDKKIILLYSVRITYRSTYIYVCI